MDRCLLQRRQLVTAAGLAGLGMPTLQAAEPAMLEGRWLDAARQQRPVPWRVYLPTEGKGWAWVVYSHGLGGSLLAGEFWGRHWAAQGIASLHLQHAGSDRAVFADGAKALQAAMSAEQLFQRVQDVRLALAEVQRRAAAGEAPWSRFDVERVGVAGHSFGAVTVQALAGQRYEPNYAASSLAEPRFRAALAFSPSMRRGEAARSFGAVKLPFLSVTGTDDTAPRVQDVEPANRLLPFEGMPTGAKYLLVFGGAGHAGFSGSTEGRRLDNRPAATERIRPLIQQASTWFWLAYLKGDAQALRMLRDLPARLPLAAEDRFRMG